jgi:hypothetical protein
VLLRANPLKTLIPKISAVVVNGRLIDKAELQRMLADAEDAAESEHNV